MTELPKVTDHSARTHVGARPLRWSAVVVSRGLKAGAADSTPHTRSTQTKPAAAVCAILGASLLAVGAVLMKPVESSGISARIDGANGSIDPHQESNMKTLHAFRTAGALSALAVTQIALVSGASAQSTAVQWKVADGGNGHWYELVISGPITWTAARASCEQRGGYLVTPTSPSENALITQLGNRADHPTAWVNDFGGNAGGPWLGGFQPVDAPIAQPWAWVTGEPWNWAGWAPGEPNGGFGPGVSVTAMLGYANSNYYRGWADAGLSDYPPYPLPPSYIIEWSADCNADNLVDYGQILDGSLIDENGNGVPDCCEQGLSCISCSACDLNPTGIVDGSDLGALLAFWGPVSPAFPRADINRDGNVNGADLGLLLANWGPCGQ